MERPMQLLDDSQKSFESRLNRWGCRQAILIILCFGSTTLAVIDPNFRDDYAKLCVGGLCGYLSQLKPQSELD
jgi:hypothetical protein